MKTTKPESIATVAWMSLCLVGCGAALLTGLSALMEGKLVEALVGGMLACVFFGAVQGARAQ